MFQLAMDGVLSLRGRGKEGDPVLLRYATA